MSKTLILNDSRRESDGSLTMVGVGEDGERVEFRGCVLVGHDVEVSENDDGAVTEFTVSIELAPAGQETSDFESWLANARGSSET